MCRRCDVTVCSIAFAINDGEWCAVVRTLILQRTYVDMKQWQIYSRFPLDCIRVRAFFCRSILSVRCQNNVMLFVAIVQKSIHHMTVKSIFQTPYNNEIKVMTKKSWKCHKTCRLRKLLLPFIPYHHTGMKKMISDFIAIWYMAHVLRRSERKKENRWLDDHERRPGEENVETYSETMYSGNAPLVYFFGCLFWYYRYCPASYALRLYNEWASRTGTRTDLTWYPTTQCNPW